MISRFAIIMRDVFEEVPQTISPRLGLILAGGAVICAGIVEGVNYLLGSPVKHDDRVMLDIFTALFGAAGAFVAVQLGSVPCQKRYISEVVARMSNPDNYMYGNKAAALVGEELKRTQLA